MQKQEVLRPLEDRILIERLKGEAVTPGGIVIPDAAREKQQRGKVLAVGPGRVLGSGRCVKPTVGVGDIVLFAKYAGSEVKVGNNECVIVRESDIEAVIE